MKSKLYFRSALLLAGAFSVLTFAQVYADGYVNMKSYLDEINTANKGKAADQVKHANPYEFIGKNITADFTTFNEKDKNAALSDLATMFAYAGGGKVAPDANAQGEVMQYTHKLIHTFSKKDEFLKAVLEKRQALMDIANPTEKQKTLKTKLVTLWDKDGNGITEEAKTHLIRLNYLLELKPFKSAGMTPDDAQDIVKHAGDNVKVIKAVWGDKNVKGLEKAIEAADEQRKKNEARVKKEQEEEERLKKEKEEAAAKLKVEEEKETTYKFVDDSNKNLSKIGKGLGKGKTPAQKLEELANKLGVTYDNIAQQDLRKTFEIKLSKKKYDELKASGINLDDLLIAQPGGA